MLRLSHMSLRTKILLFTTAAIAAGFAVMISIIACHAYQSDKQEGLQLLQEQTQAYASQVEGRFTAADQLPLNLTLAVQGMQGKALPDRKAIDALIIRMLEAQPLASGLWMIWEPNALDGKDDMYRSDWPVHDPSRRYTPYIIRSEGKIAQDTMLGADQKKQLSHFAKSQ